jgi:uncharacterized membrane protein
MLDDTDRALTWGFAALILVSLAGIGFFALAPQTMSDPYTEFYVLGAEGNASDYPTNLAVDESGEVTVGVTNQEHEPRTYTVVVRLADETVGRQSLTLGDEETWQEAFEFTPDSPGQQDLQILLFRGEDPNISSEPYRELWLKFDVRE